MGKLAPMHHFPVLVFIICGHLLLQINATFYVEVHDSGEYDSVGINLFECNVPAALRRPLSTGSSRTLVPSYSTDDDISCKLVTSRQRKREIYSTTNFHLVVNPRLPGNKRILLGPARPAPHNTFIGATIIGAGVVDYPALLGDLDETWRSRLRNKCVRLPDHFLPRDRNFETIPVYMGLANFRQFANPSLNMVFRFQLFAEIVGRVQSHYNYNIRYAKINKRTPAQQTQAESDVKGALKILLPKLIDPCFVESYIQESGQRFAREGTQAASIELANIICEYHCLLISAAFSLHPTVSTATCRGQLVRGECQNRVCKCMKLAKSMIAMCVARPKYVTMIECSNDLRTGLGDSVNFGVE